MSERAKEYVYVRVPGEGATCDVHEWTAEDFRKRLLAEMRARHGKGGLNVCVDCLDRAKAAVMVPVP